MNEIERHPATRVMKILSVNVGLPRQALFNGKTVTTGIFKTPVHRRVKVKRLNLEDDGQADPSVHGGPNKAVYAYPAEHYSWWRSQFPGVDLPWGTFGENLTVKGLTEDNAHIGDSFKIGTVVLMVTQPRLPCYKLGIKFRREDMPERFLTSRRTGFYFAVVKEGELGEGDVVEPIARDPNQISISTILHLYRNPEYRDAELIKRILQIEALPAGWRKRFLKRFGESSTD